jgi:hypothetical protein
MTKVWIGVDPGLQGAIAILAPDRIEVVPMPVVTAAKGRDQYNLQEIVELLDTEAACAGCANVLVTIEKQQPMPMDQGGTIANYNRGRSMALVEGICAALGMPYQLVAPRTWQGVLHRGTSGADTKQRSIMAAQRLFPRTSLLRTPRSRVPHDGMAEALLLARYGQRSQGGVDSLVGQTPTPLRRVS